MFVEEFLRLVNFGGQVWTTAAIGVVEQHELAVVLADLVFGQSSFTERYCQFWHIKGLSLALTQVVESETLPDGSCAVRILCYTLVNIPYDHNLAKCPRTPYRMPFRQRSILLWSGGKRPDRRGPVDNELVLCC